MLSAYLPRSIKTKIPYSVKRTSTFLKDLFPALAFMCNPRKQSVALQELAACEGMTEYFIFARRWLGREPIQNEGEIAAAINYLKSKAPRHILEIGTAYGGTTFLLNHQLNSAELFIGIDIYVRNRARLKCICPSKQDIHLISASSYDRKTVEKVEMLLKNKKLDVLFIDGDHRYHSVKKDFLRYKHLVRENGLIFFHDIIEPHHVMGNGKVPRSYSGGVPVLWKQLKQIFPCLEFIDNPNQDGMGIGVVRFSSSIVLPDYFIDKN